MRTSRTIRLFVSSTFSDLKAERNALQQKVFPRLKQLCLSKGLRFQAIDLRWGISEEAGRDNRTMRICLRELKRCQQGRPKPNFLILLGDRYGWRPLPETIPADLFERLEKQVRATDPGTADLLGRHYRRDDNAAPPVYELQPRQAPYDEDFDRWQREVELPLLNALAGAAKAAGVDLDAAGISVGASATEQEIVAGALKVADARDHVRAFFRTIDGLPANPPPKDFVDLAPDGQRDAQAAGRLDALKERITRHIADENICKYRVRWTGHGIAPGDLDGFCEQVWQRLSAVVLRQIESLAGLSPDEQEEEAQQAFGEERRRGFVGRAEPLDRIAGYLREGPVTPLAVVGPAGSGKSAVMAEAVRRATQSHPDAHVIARYIGATPASADIIQLLRNLVGEIRRRYPLASPQPSPDEARQAGPSDAEIPFEFNALVNAFHEALGRAKPERPLHLFLDAIDQLSAGNNAHNLAWLPASLPGPVRLAVSAALPNDRGTDPHAASDPRVAVMEALESRTIPDQRVTLSPLTPADGRCLLDQWSADAGRILQDPQRRAILAAFAQEGNPLWLRTAADEAGRLRSWDPPPSPAPRVGALMGQVLDRLSGDDEHGAVLVARALGYIACARHGLAEDELLDVLSQDDALMANFRQRFPNWNNPPLAALPVAVWVRLHGDIAFYLTEHQAQGASLLGFYHRSFLEAVQAGCLASSEVRRQRYQHLAEWFGRQGWFIPIAAGRPGEPAAEGTFSDPPNTRKASELPWHLYKAADESDPQHCLEPIWQPLADVLCDLHLVEAKSRSDLVFELEEDYRSALQALPEAQAGLEEERRHHETLARYTADLIAHAQACSARRDRLARGEQVAEPEPEPPDPVPSCRMWTKEKIQAECRRMVEHPTRLDRMKAFAGFVESQCYPLLNHGRHPGFVLQHAFNTDPAGPVHEAAASLLPALAAPQLLRRHPAGATYNPRSALLRTLEGHGNVVESVSVTPDGRRAVSGSYDETLRVWDLESGACLRTLEGHSGEVQSVSVTPDGRRAVSGSKPGFPG